MLHKHTALYLLARGLPGLVNFLAISIYTRLLSPVDYGRYALVVAGVGLFNVVFFQWLRLALLRFLPTHLESPKALLSTILAGFSALALLTGGLGLLLAYIWPDPTWRGLMLLAIPLLWTQAWFELNLELTRSRLLPLRYGLLSGFKSVAALGLGLLLVLWGMGAYGPLVGLLCGMLVIGLGPVRRDWKGIKFKLSKPLALNLARYGLPLTATFALGFVVSASDRFLIAAFLDESAAGMYSAGYDLAQHSLTLLMTIINLAAYPLLVRTLERDGKKAAQVQALNNATVLIAISLPASAGIAILAPNISSLVFGEAFREQTVTLLPVISLGVLFAGIKAYHFDLAFQLGHWTLGQVWVSGIAAFANVMLNLWWIPRLGLMGAAYATVAAYGIALVLSAVYGRKVFAIAFPWTNLFRVIIATSAMALALWPLLQFTGLFGLMMQVVAGSIVYSLAFLALNIAESRAYAMAWVRRLG